MKTFDARTLPRWRKWLADHHASESEIAGDLVAVRAPYIFVDAEHVVALGRLGHVRTDSFICSSGC